MTQCRSSQRLGGHDVGVVNDYADMVSAYVVNFGMKWFLDISQYVNTKKLSTKNDRKKVTAQYIYILYEKYTVTFQ